MKYYYVRVMTPEQFENMLCGNLPIRGHFALVQARSPWAAELRVHMRQPRDYVAEGYTFETELLNGELRFTPPLESWRAWEE